MTDEIAFVEGEEDVEVILKIIDITKTKIISFDFEAHKKLEGLGIKHDFVEEYITEEDELDIDNKTVELTTGWYLHPNLAKYLKYDEINIGSLLEIELIWYFFEYLKRMMGIKRVIEKENPKKIFTVFLSDCTELVCKDKTIKLIKNKSKKKIGLFFDSIEIPIGIRGKLISMKVSRKKFLLMKKIITRLVNILYRIKPDFQKLKTRKTILLSDYNPISYKKLLEILSVSKSNIILLNQRRPAIWNYQSLQIIKNLKCKIIELDDFSNRNNKFIVQREINNAKIQLKNLWNKDDVFREIFQIGNNSFWKAIKENFSELITARYLESIERIILLNELFKSINISCILEWAHVGLEDKMIVTIANKKKIPNMFLQHGLYIQNTKFDKYIPMLPILPTNGSKHLVWGKILHEFIIKQGVKQEEVIMIGSPRYDEFFKNEHKKKTNQILIAANGLFHNNCHGTDTRALIKMENFVRKIFETTKKYPDKKFIVKLHPGKVSFDIKPLIQEIVPMINVYQNENILELLEDCDSMISLNYSTVILDAMILHKPTLVLLPEKQNFENEIAIKSGAALFTSDENKIESLINDLLRNNEIREKLVKNGDEFVNNYITNQGSASEKLAKILENYD
ncbi:MAG: UDP-N-acetylglucosamine 2-epimerase [Nitrosarchaeum sp.]